jgi:hypothetical protein
MRGRLPLIALAALTLGALATPEASATLHPADVTTTVDFEAYSPGTQIKSQYSGITFEYPTSAGFTGGTPADGVARCGNLPVVVAGYAHSGANAGELYHLNEFSVFGTFAAFTNLADAVSVYVGTTNGASAQVELDAYDANRHLLPGSVTANTSGSGANTLFSYSTGGKGEIAYIALCSTSVGDLDGVIDDLSFSVPPTTKPIVGVSTVTTTYEVGQGASRAIPLSVVRLDGATGPVTLNLSGLPTGVTSSFSENPVAAADTATTLTLDVPSNVVSGNYPISLSASASGATSQAPTVLTLSVAPAITTFPPSKTYEVGACGSASVPLGVDVGPGLPGPVSFTLDTTPLPAGLSASFSPAQATIYSGSAQTNLELSSTGGSGTSSLQVTASLPSGASTTFNVSVGQVGPEVTSVDSLGGQVTYTPRAQKPGTTVEVYGHNFCGTATVALGNDQATVTATVKHNNIYGDYVRVETPRDATSGPITVTAGSPPVSGTSSQSLTVDSYRNVEAFNFHNFDTGFSLQDLTNAFGSQQTYININPCGIFTLGLANCNVAVAPDPVALAWLAVANAALEGGTCFGISLTDQRLLSGQIDLKSLPRSADTVYGLDAPAVGSDGWARGNEPLLQVLKAQHLMQFSTEYLSQVAELAPLYAVAPSGQVVASIAKTIKDVFAAGRYPLIDMFDSGEGHVVVAYDLAPDGSGGYDIYVYDNNNPYTSNENDGGTHATAVAASIIHLKSDGTWALPSTTDGSNSAFHGGQGAIFAFDPADVPLHPTLGTLGGLAPGLLVSSNSAPGGPVGNQAGAGHITQVSGPGGKVLYNPNGTLDTNRATRLQAEPFYPVVGKRASSLSPQMVVVGPAVRQLSVATTGKARGGSTTTFLDGGFMGSVSASTQPGAHEQVSFSAANGTVDFHSATSAPFSLRVDQVSARGSRTVQVTSSGAVGGGAALTLNPRSGALSLARQGGAATFTLTLSGELQGGLPASFSSGPIKVGTGQVVTVAKVNWGSLATAHLSVRIGKRSVPFSNHLKVRLVAKIAKLQAVPAVQHLKRTVRRGLRLIVNGKLAGLSPSGRVVVVWVVHHGKRTVARHIATLQPKDKPFSSSWFAPLAKTSGLTFSAEVVAIAVNGALRSSSVATSSIGLSAP